MFLVGIVLIAICFLQAVLGLLQYFTVCYSPPNTNKVINHFGTIYESVKE